MMVYDSREGCDKRHLPLLLILPLLLKLNLFLLLLNLLLLFVSSSFSLAYLIALLILLLHLLLLLAALLSPAPAGVRAAPLQHLQQPRQYAAWLRFAPWHGPFETVQANTRLHVAHLPWIERQVVLALQQGPRMSVVIKMSVR